LASGKPVPTILIIAYPDAGVRQRALSSGAVGYLRKLFEEDDLIACIRSDLTSAGSRW
jgi:CheY-like chemotaxis protein